MSQLLTKEEQDFFEKFFTSKWELAHDRCIEQLQELMNTRRLKLTKEALNSIKSDLYNLIVSMIDRRDFEVDFAIVEGSSVKFTLIPSSDLELLLQQEAEILKEGDPNVFRRTIWRG